MQTQWIKDSLLNDPGKIEIPDAKKKTKELWQIPWMIWKINSKGIIKEYKISARKQEKILCGYARFLNYYTKSMSHSILKIMNWISSKQIKNFYFVQYTAKRM